MVVKNENCGKVVRLHFWPCEIFRSSKEGMHGPMVNMPMVSYSKCKL